MDRGQTPTFGALLRRYRLARGLTQEALAERAELSVRTVSDLERGVNLTPRKDTLPLLATALELLASESSRLEAAARRMGGAPPPLLAAPSTAVPPFVGREREVSLLR